ncbi:T9SS type B sorting domain-containing protein [Leptobacterium sp. I13]|uniref:T9SS type B sorting domain-containing protein n=1 Tax=Leptobacterium meishanense TaxID=3128904 RepID=UPI0030ED9B53
MLCIYSYAQSPNDCVNAIVVCGSGSISSNASGIGTQELFNTNNCGSQENNSLWLRINIVQAGTLGFTLTPTNTNLSIDYDFFVFGPNVSCGNIGQAIRCSTTNPTQAGLTNNLTGMSDNEIDFSEGPGSLGNSFVRSLDVLPGESYFIVIDRPIGTSAFTLDWTGTAIQGGTSPFPDAPVINQPDDIEVCSSSGIATFDLAAVIPQITSDVVNNTISFHSSEADANDNTNPLPSMYDNIANPETIYVRATNNTTGCFSLTSFNLTVSNTPNINTPTDFELCDTNNDTTETFDLSSKDNEILNGLDPNLFSISYHVTLNDAENDSNPLPNNYQNTSNPQTIYARVADISTGCIGIASFDLLLLPLPNIATPTNFELCDIDNDIVESFDLSSKDSEILNGLDPNLFSISYHVTLNDAENDSNPLPNNYQNTSNPQTIYSRVTNNNTGCFATAAFDLILLPLPNIATPTNFELCDEGSDAIESFDLSTKNNELLNGLDPNLFSISYHLNLNDAENNSNPLPNNYQNTSNPQTIYSRVTNNNTGCFATAAFDLILLPLPNIATPTNFELCDIDNDIVESFDLSSKDSEILNGLDPNLFSISYHVTLNDAENDSNPLPNNYQNTSNPQTVYSRVTDNNTGCFATTAFDLLLILLPPANNSMLLQCDVDVTDSTDGITGFNLNEAYNAVTGSVQGLILSFYETTTDLVNDNPITNPIGYQNTIAFNQTIFVKVIDESTGCENTAQLDLQVQPTFASLPEIGPFFTCDLNGEDSILEGSFNLDIIRDTNYPSTLDVAFYSSLNDAALEVNRVNGTNFISEPTTLFVRIENNNQCQGIEQFDLIVDPLPIVNIQEEYTLCLNNLPLNINAETGFDTYQWFNINTNNEVLISQAPNVAITEPGTYRLELTTNYNDFGTIRQCSNSKTFNVSVSNIASITNIEINDLNGNDDNSVVINVGGEGNYEFALDSAIGTYQDSNLFEGLSPGIYTVYIRDKNGCGIVDEEVSVIGYPRFFTPNGDGTNDTWHILGINDMVQQNSTIFIFDRYGKLLTQLIPGREGWDGTYNGNPLPASDYWFKVTLEDGRQFTGHFAMKR